MSQIKQTTFRQQKINDNIINNYKILHRTKTNITETPQKLEIYSSIPEGYTISEIHVASVMYSKD